MSRTPTSASPEALVLRTAAVWGTFVLASRELRSGESLSMGEGRDALYPKPDTSSIADLPIRSVGRGWELDASGATGGLLHLRGRKEDPCELGKSGAPIPIVPGDYGLLQYGSLSFFFQFAHPAPALKSRWRVDLSLVLAFAFAVITVGGSLLLLYMLYPERDLDKPLELTSARELEVKYHFIPPPPEPAPDAEAEGAEGAKTKTPETAPGNPRGPKRPTPEAPAAGSGGPPASVMTEVLHGAVGKEVLETLGTIGSVSEALGDLSSAGLVLGGASSGVGGNGTGNGRAGERRLAAAAVSASGQGLSAEQISRVVRARSGAFRACYESAAAREPKLQGGVTVNFTVSTTGAVTARIANSSLANPRVESCVLRMFNRLHFPSADKPTSANWPLVFRPGK